MMLMIIFIFPCEVYHVQTDWKWDLFNELSPRGSAKWIKTWTVIGVDTQSWLVTTNIKSSACFSCLPATPGRLVDAGGGRWLQLCFYGNILIFIPKIRDGKQQRVDSGGTTSMRESSVVQKIHERVPVWTSDLLRVQEILWFAEPVRVIKRLRGNNVYNVWHEWRKTEIFLLYSNCVTTLLLSVVILLENEPKINQMFRGRIVAYSRNPVVILSMSRNCNYNV